MSLGVLMMAFVGLALWSTPFWFRKDVQFGVTITDRLAGEIVKRVRWAWLLAEAVVLLGGTVGFAFWLGVNRHGAAWPLVQLIYVAFALAVWAAGWAWAHTRLLHERDRACAAPSNPSAPREASLRPRRFVEHYSVGAAFAAALILIAWCAWLAHVYPELPARIAVHFDASGQPNGWASHSFGGVLFLPGVGVILWIILDLIAYTVIHARVIAHSGPAGQSEHAYRHSVLQFLQWMKPVMILFLAWVQVTTLLPQIAGRPAVFGPEQALLPLLLFFAYIIAGIGWMGQARMRETGSAPAGGDMTSDEKWMFGGLLYYNTADPALLVEKRTGLGYTFNMARPVAWLILLLILGLALLPALLPRLLR